MLFRSPAGTLLIVDTLTDNSNRALVSVRTIITRKGGHLGSVGYNFENAGLFDFNYSGTEESLEEALVLGDVDVKEISLEDGVAEVVVSPSDFEKAKEILAMCKKHFMTSYDESGSIGKRYRRADAIGTPWQISVDEKTVEENIVTLRDRDTMEQIELKVNGAAVPMGTGRRLKINVEL